MRAAVETLSADLLKWRRSGRTGLAVRGTAWTMAGYIATQLLRTAATLVLARRFLGPEMFGIAGLVGVFLAGLSMFSELGLVANIVQHARGDDPGFLSTAFSIQAARGLAIWIVSMIAAFPLAVFYKEPQLLPLLAVAGISELLRGLTSTAAWQMTRHVNLRSITLLAVAAEIIASALGIVWALVAPSAWALVARTIAAAGVYAAGSHFLGRGATGFGWDRSAAKDILHFGGWISISTAAYFLGGQGERLILAKFITPAELGCFSLALMISAVPTGGIRQLISQIVLPMISSTVRTSHTQVVSDFLRARRMFAALGLIAGSGFLVCANPFVRLLLPPKYAMVGWMLQILGVRVAMDIFAGPLSSLVLAYGQTKYSAAGNATRLVLMVAGVWLAFSRFGIREAMLALAAAQAFSYFPLIAALPRLLPEATRLEIRWYGFFLTCLLLGIAVSLRGA